VSFSTWASSFGLCSHADDYLEPATIAIVADRATLRLDGSDEVPVEVVYGDTDRDRVVVRRIGAARKGASTRNLVAAVDAHLASATPHR
jgi:hypothetical protein